MPTSLIIVALVVAWLVVLVPIVARRRQEVAKPAEATLAARVVHSGGVRDEAKEELVVPERSETELDLTTNEDAVSEESDFEYDGMSPRPFRPGRGGFDPDAAAIAAQAKYAFRQRVVLSMLALAVMSALLAGFFMPVLWWGQAAADIAIVSYLFYLRRQVRIEEAIRERRASRIGTREDAYEFDYSAEESFSEDESAATDIAPVATPDWNNSPRGSQSFTRLPQNTVVVDLEDEDPQLAELEGPDVLPYRRAVGE